MSRRLRILVVAALAFAAVFLCGVLALFYVYVFLFGISPLVVFQIPGDFYDNWKASEYQRVDHDAVPEFNKGPVNCDDELRGVLADRETSKSSLRDLYGSVSLVQEFNRYCSPGFWDPRIAEPGIAGPELCFPGGSAAAGRQASIGGISLPPGFRVNGDLDGRPTGVSGGSVGHRSRSFVIYWSLDNRPDDGAACWMYIADAERWFANY